VPVLGFDPFTVCIIPVWMSAGERFDVIIDPVGGPVRTVGIGLLAPGGRLLLAGNARIPGRVSRVSTWRAAGGMIGAGRCGCGY